MEKEPETALDKGQLNLERDLRGLLVKAQSFEFHDFKNKNYASPKMTLRGYLLQMAENVLNGEYDN